MLIHQIFLQILIQILRRHVNFSLCDSTLYEESRKIYSILALSHCKEGPIYVFPDIKLRGLVPNVHIRVSVSDLNIATIGPPILLQQNRQTNPDTDT
jgi:hypothetical protein